jgi:hypothetical protein
MAAFKYRSFQAIQHSFQVTRKADQEKSKVILSELEKQYQQIEQVFKNLSQSTLSELQKSKLATAAILAVKTNTENNAKRSHLFIDVDKIIGVNERNKLDNYEIDMLANALKRYMNPLPFSTFKFRPFKDLNEKAEALMKKVEVEHKSSKIKKNDQKREQQFEHLRSVSSMKILNSEERSELLTGAWLNTKEIIKNTEYGGMWGYASIIGVTPDNSTLFKGIDDVIGDTPENPLDPVAKNKALAAYNRFVAMTEEIKTFDQSKLKKVSSPLKEMTNKGIVLEDGTSKNLLRPWWKLAATLKDEKLHPRVKANLLRTVESYTPASEIDRYDRDQISKSSYQQMQKVKEEFNEKSGVAKPGPSYKWIFSGLRVLQVMLDQGLTNAAMKDSSSVKRGEIRSATSAESEMYRNREKLKAAWKGVKDPEVKETEKVKQIKTVTNVRAQAHLLITSRPKLKHAETKETHKIVVDHDVIETSRWKRK